MSRRAMCLRCTIQIPCCKECNFSWFCFLSSLYCQSLRKETNRVPKENDFRVGSDPKVSQLLQIKNATTLQGVLSAVRPPTVQSTTPGRTLPEGIENIEISLVGYEKENYVENVCLYTSSSMTDIIIRRLGNLRRTSNLFFRD